jgi:hypothetical protein
MRKVTLDQVGREKEARRSAKGAAPLGAEA